MSFVLLMSFAIVCIGFVLVRTRVKVSRISRLTWEDLIGRLQPVPGNGITQVALDYLHPRKEQLRIEPAEMWAMIGEADGLECMRANAEVVILLAGYAQRWNFSESVIVAERMRADGLALRRAVRRISLGLLLGYGKTRGPFYLQQAASSYYLMSQRLLALYETSHAGRFPVLAATRFIEV